MKSVIKAVVFALIIVFTMTMLSPICLAEKTLSLQERTLEDVFSKYRERPFKIKGSEWVEYDIEPSSSYPYRAGKVKDKYLQEALDALNFIRYLAGLPDDVYLDETYTSYAQHGAVLLAAVNKLTHHPPKPEDMADDFYEIAYKGPSRSNCGYGYRNILETIFGYMNDSDPSNIASVGHRRWLLSPQLQKTGFGYYKSYSTTYVFDISREDKILFDFISWPAKNYMPVEFMESNIAWSVNLGREYDQAAIDDVKVTLIRKNDGRTWTFSKNTSYGNTKNYFNVDHSGYGYEMNNCIIFRPDIEEYKENDIFNVAISGIYKGGKPTEIKYTVQLFSLLKPTQVKADKPEGTYINEVEVALSCDTPYAEIFYTTDGSVPHLLSKKYREPIKITDTTVIKAFTYIDGKMSKKSTFHYKIEKVSPWAVLDIEKAIYLKLIPTSMQNNYRENISRADFCKLAINFLVQKTGKQIDELLMENNVSINYNAFTDVSDKEILAANALGIVSGLGNGRFNPDGKISRQEAAVMLMRTAKLLDVEMGDEVETFADSHAFADWAKDAIAFVSSLKDKTNNAKVMGGVGNGNFSPNSSYTREQAFVTILRLFNAVE